ncbi:class I SAM-dependent methyltransferase [Micromonospora aurantiaca]|uniref:class I SAM-dependent methyltransferase n=1 Tax=Micromonospora aurantiaca (nom. illeg.) TaxID=47850 RepID=UPI0013C30CBC|nr:class I SAM-dependent methyltransferase [Micromonospora aurantiaca]
MAAQRDRIAAHFDARAPNYARAAGWVTDPVSLEPVITLLSRRPSGVALEIGAGSGAVAQAVAMSSAKVRSYVGVDISPAMAREHARHAPSVIGDGHHLPIAGGRIGTVICRQSFHYLQHPDAALAEVVRVLAPDGRLLIAQIVPFDEASDQAWWSTAMKIRQPLRKHFWTDAELRSTVERCGFAVEPTYELRRRTSLNEWVDRYSLESAARAALLEHFASTPAPVRSLRAFAESDGDVDYDLRWVFITARPTGAYAESDEARGSADSS